MEASGKRATPRITRALSPQRNGKLEIGSELGAVTNADARGARVGYADGVHRGGELRRTTGSLGDDEGVPGVYDVARGGLPGGPSIKRKVSYSFCPGMKMRHQRTGGHMKALNGVALILVIVGALNWGLIAIGEFDLVAELFGEEFGTTNAVTRIVYGLVGIAGVYLAATLLPAVLRSDDRIAFGRRNPQSVR
jgi:uncharacterized membrane protein YuzA (DUF378 family)